MRIIALISLIFIGAAAQGAAFAKSTAGFTDKPFRVSALWGSPVGTEVEQTLSFDARGTLTGNGGCNTFSAGFVTSGDAIMVQPVRSAHMVCPEPAMGLEKRLIDALEGAVNFAFDPAAGTLDLVSADRRVMVHLEQ